MICIAVAKQNFNWKRDFYGILVKALQDVNICVVAL